MSGRSHGSGALEVFPSLEAIHAADRYCELQGKRIYGIDAENSANTDQLETINEFLARVRADQKGKGDEAKLDYSTSQEMQERIAEVRRIAPDVIPENCHSWSGDEIRRLEDSLVNHEKVITNRFNPGYMRMKQLFEDQNRVVDIIRELIKEQRESISNINRRTGRSGG
jgi:hypothetical protein